MFFVKLLRQQLLHLRPAEKMADDYHERRTADGERIVHHEGLFRPTSRNKNVGGYHAACDPTEKPGTEINNGRDSID